MRHGDLVIPGKALVYDVMVSNLGDSVLTGVTLEHTLPSGVVFDSSTSSGGCYAADANVRCNLGTMTDFSSKTISIAGTIASGITAGTMLTSTSHVFANEVDPNPANNLVSVVAHVVGQLFMPEIMLGSGTALPTDVDLIVQDIRVTPDTLQIVVKNVGSAPLLPSNSLWLDVYFNPDIAPTAVNQVWSDMGSYGLVWGIESEGLRLMPGETIMLDLNSPFYFPNLSQLPNQLAAGSAIYAHVDSANLNTSYGAVLETHERTGQAYNNITMIRLPSTLSTAGWRKAVESSSHADSTESSNRLEGILPRP